MVGVLHVYAQIARRFVDLQRLLEEARSETTERPPTAAIQRQALPRATAIEALVQRYSAGESTYRLAEAFGIRRNTVRDVLRREGLPITGAKLQSLTDEEKENIRTQFAAGSTRRKLAAEYAVSESTIRRALKPRR